MPKRFVLGKARKFVYKRQHHVRSLKPVKLTFQLRKSVFLSLQDGVVATLQMHISFCCTSTILFIDVQALESYCVNELKLPPYIRPVFLSLAIYLGTITKNCEMYSCLEHLN